MMLLDLKVNILSVTSLCLLLRLGCVPSNHKNIFWLLLLDKQLGAVDLQIVTLFLPALKKTLSYCPIFSVN